MLRWLLILTMALLPWHGWAGASLAPAAPTVIPADAGHRAVAAIDHHADPGQASADCLDHGASAAVHHAAAADDAGCAGCSMCNACSTAGLPAVAGVPQAGSAPPQRPAGATSRFASAEPLQGLKPPIS